MTTPTTREPESSAWRQLIEAAQGDHRPLEEYPRLLDDQGRYSTPSEEWLDTPFTNDYGRSGATACVLWTDRRIYFPIRYDGLVSVASVPRLPAPGMRATIIESRPDGR